MMESHKNAVEHLNPEGLHKSPAFTQAVVVRGAVKTIYIGGQNAVNAAGEIVGKGDLKTQMEQIFRNLQIALEACEATLENVVKWNIYALAEQPIAPALEVFQKVWGNRPNPPVITVAFVVGLAHPDFLAELEATAVVPQ
jgi:enamine deaminase RidA (YjgF/YER057c/UK114 family)